MLSVTIVDNSGVLVLALGLVLATGCRPTSNEWVTSEPMLTGASVVRTEDAVQRIAGAACRREIACGRIGPKRDHVDVHECMVDQRGAAHTSLAASCPSGIVEQSLEHCVDALQTATCGLRLTTPAQLVECRRSQLCGVNSRDFTSP